jgi:hypothetical protein
VGFLDSIFWKGIKVYNLVLFDVSEEGEFIKEVKQLYTKPGISFTLKYDPEERDKQIKLFETALWSEEHTRNRDEGDIQITKGSIKLLKCDLVKVFTAVVTIDTKYIPKQEKNDLIEKRENAQEKFYQKMMKENPN